MSEAATTETTTEATEATSEPTETSSSTDSEVTSTETTESSESSEGKGGIADAIAASGKSSSDKESGDATAESGDDAGDGDESPKGAPSEYSAFKAPDGFAWSEDNSGDFTELAREKGWTQEEANEVFEFMSEHHTDSVLPEIKAKQDAKYDEYRNDELRKAKMDPDLVGPNGDQWDATLSYVQQVVTKFAGPGTIGEGHFAELKDKGYMDSHAFLKVMTTIGRALMPDALDLEGGSGADKSDDDLHPSRRMGWDENANPLK